MLPTMLIAMGLILFFLFLLDSKLKVDKLVDEIAYNFWDMERNKKPHLTIVTSLKKPYKHLN